MQRVPHQSVKIAAMMEHVCRAAYDSDKPRLLGPSQWAVLRYFATARREARTVTGLARHLAGTKGPASRSIAALERRGLLQGRRDSADLRLVIFELTVAGKALMANDPLRRFALRIAVLPAPDRKSFVKVLRRLQESN